MQLALAAREKGEEGPDDAAVVRQMGCARTHTRTRTRTPGADATRESAGDDSAAEDVGRVGGGGAAAGVEDDDDDDDDEEEEEDAAAGDCSMARSRVMLVTLSTISVLRRAASASVACMLRSAAVMVETSDKQVSRGAMT